VATQGTVTLMRSAIRGLLGACRGELKREIRAALARDDAYQAARKPPVRLARRPRAPDAGKRANP